jgi:nicotinamidase-related amidase
VRRHDELECRETFAAPCDALLVVDVQRDFLAQAPLRCRVATPCWHRSTGQSILSQRKSPRSSWHPLGHCSFKTHGGPWPRHCVSQIVLDARRLGFDVVALRDAIARSAHMTASGHGRRWQTRRARRLSAATTSSGQ